MMLGPILLDFEEYPFCSSFLILSPFVIPNEQGGWGEFFFLPYGNGICS
jgi:hypothetical protein